MVLKIAAIVALVAAGLFFAPSIPLETSLLDRPVSFDLLTAIGASLVPVFFAYGGWQTASFVAGELREPRRDLPRGLLLGVIGVVVCYLAVNFVCVHALGVAGLAATKAPASEIMRVALGEPGARFIAVGIAISTVGFLSQGMLTAPRVYYAMAEDGLFFKSVGWLHPKTRVPVVAIALQGILAMLIAVSGQYEQILNYVVSVDFIAFGLTATCIFVFRRRDDGSEGFRVPGHPWTTLFFVAASWLVVLNTIYKYPANSAIGLAIVCAGVPVYYLWRRKRG
jgi:APA family basic amino acid/polyamine antiporter